MIMDQNKLEFRVSKASDEKPLIKWLMVPEVLLWFPMANYPEVEDSARVWLQYAKIGASITALYEGELCGMGILYIQGYKKFAHQCLFAIIMSDEYRGKGIGTLFLEYLINLAKETFKIELLHLEVYEDNPAISLYKRFGFIEYGRHENFIKEPDRYRAKILMQKNLR